MPHRMVGESQPSLSHFVIFSPTLSLARPPSSPSPSDHDNGQEERDKDLEDDLREAAKIWFYTAREAGGVSRDTMLRQVGLVKGLMGFADMLAKEEEGKAYMAVHSHRSRIVVYSPEPEIYIYVNITLAHQQVPTPSSSQAGPSYTSKTRGEPVPTAQGLSDEMIVDALSRGYADFRLLHGPLPALLGSTRLPSLLEQHFTRFAFSVEANLLHSPTPLLQWLQGYPAPPEHLAQAVDGVVRIYLEDCELSADGDARAGVLGENGPLGDGEKDEPMIRFLMDRLRASLPPPPPSSTSAHPQAPAGPETGSRGTLGFGLRGRKGEPRKTSWAATSLGWVGLGEGARRGSVDSLGSAVGKAKEDGKEREQKGGGRWSLGLGGLGDAMGSVGTVLGLGGSEQGLKGVAREQGTEEAGGQTGSRGGGPPIVHDGKPVLGGAGVEGAEVKESVEPERVSLPDLEAAQQVDEAIELGWEGRSVWIRRSGASIDTYDKRHLMWTIRDNNLLYLLHPPSTTLVEAPGDPSPRPTLALFSRLATLLPGIERTSLESTPRPSTPSAAATISVVYRHGQVLEQSRPPIDGTAGDGAALMDLKNLLASDASVQEVYARTPASRFVVAKRGARAPVGDVAPELYMLVGRKDASLTDAEQAVRSFTRTRPELVG